MNFVALQVENGNWFLPILEISFDEDFWVKTYDQIPVLVESLYSGDQGLLDSERPSLHIYEFTVVWIENEDLRSLIFACDTLILISL